MNSPDDLERLVAQLRNTHGVARARARERLVALGEEAVAALVPFLTDSEKQVRWEAVKALSDIGSETAASAVIPLLEDRDPGIRWLAAQALVAAGAGSVPLLLRRLIDRSDSAYLRQGAHHVFRALSREYEPFRSILAPIMAALENPQAADVVPETARDALHAWHALPEKDASRPSPEPDLQYLFDSRGDFVAFRRGAMVFDANADWIGWLPWDDPDVVTPEGTYLGTICQDDRFYTLPDRPDRGYPGFPGYPDQPPLPATPEPRGHGDLPAGAKDVRLNRP